MKEELREEGIVIGTNDKSAKVQLIENDNCEECEARLFCKPSENDKKIVEVRNDLNLIVGDKVSIIIAGKDLLRASIILYLLPLMLIIVSLLSGEYFFTKYSNSEIYSLLILSITLSIYYVIIYLSGKKKTAPQIIVRKI